MENFQNSVARTQQQILKNSKGATSKGGKE